MAIKLPDGSILSIATEYGEVIEISDVSNAETAIVTATSHGLSKGDFIEVSSGWGHLNARIGRVGAVTEDTFELQNMDTSDENRFIPGNGGGSVRKILARTQITQVLDFSMSGGEQQYVNVQFLEDDFERQLPSTTSAQSITIGIGDDPTLAGYKAVKRAKDKNTNHALFLTLRDGSQIAFNGLVSLNETPKLTKGSVMQVDASFSLQAEAMRY